MILVLLAPRANVRKSAQPLDAGIGPELDEQDFPAQAVRRQWPRIEPGGRTPERRQLNCLAGLCVGRTDHPELGGCYRHGRTAQKTAAIMVDFCGHFSLSYSEIACPLNTGRPVSETGSAQAASVVASILPGVVITLVTALMLPCVALEYGHSWCAPSARAWATSRSIPGRLTLRRA